MAFVTVVRPGALWRLPLAASAVALALYLGIIAIAAKSGSGRTVLATVILFFLVGAAMFLASWFAVRRLRSSTFVVDADGMEIRTPRVTRRIPWSDVDRTTLAPARGGSQLVLAVLRAGVPAPARTPIGFPQWSNERNCVIVMRIESFETTPGDVTKALRQHAGAAYRPDG